MTVGVFPGVGVPGVGVAEPVTVCVALTVSVAVGVGVDVTVAVTVDVAVGVIVVVGVGVGVAVDVGASTGGATGGNVGCMTTPPDSSATTSPPFSAIEIGFGCTILCTSRYQTASEAGSLPQAQRSAIDARCLQPSLGNLPGVVAPLSRIRPHSFADRCRSTPN